MSFPLIYEHRDFIVTAKPTGLSVHREQTSPGLLEYLQAEFNYDKLWLLHRLDKLTSGIILIGKNEEAAAKFGQLFSEKAIQKYYVAIGTQKPNKKQGKIIGDMKKVRDGKWMLQKSRENPATTLFHSIGLEGKRLFMVKPITGKTHQIRVALKSIGSPIVGDPLYGNAMDRNASADRMYLHAYCVRFKYQNDEFSFTNAPNAGQLFESALFDKQFEQYREPWNLTWPNL